MTKRKTLLFDLGGVLIENTGFNELNRLLPQKLYEHEIRERWLASTAVRRFELGELSPERFASDFIMEWGLPLSPARLLEGLRSWLKGFYPGAKALIKHLRRDHRVCCLSNSNPIHWSQFPELSAVFDRAFSSHLIGFIKPDHAAFYHVLKELGVGAHEVHFFDDSLTNIKASREIGIKSYHIRTFSELEPVLRRQKLL